MSLTALIRQMHPQIRIDLPLFREPDHMHRLIKATFTG
jgi:hypothetical protein